MKFWKPTMILIPTSTTPVWMLDFDIFTDNGMFKSDEASNDYCAVQKSFLFGMGTLAEETRTVGIHKNMAGKAPLNSFKIE
ncbi:hypothetical protein Ddye_025021 [Dipteronia dyeriana]|uniref:Uncharacterized protein n=1 Tax=Dipteronia dyeriana TaxID=168575 RepID=A0AAD9TWI7_9ROSI|nr:hypothetical protein Ddye_025021 [Dipteronia dyeriana]